jgi:hypothetical protein
MTTREVCRRKSFYKEEYNDSQHSEIEEIATQDITNTKARIVDERSSRDAGKQLWQRCYG